MLITEYNKLIRQKKWNKDNGTARKLIVDRHKNKQKNKGWSNGS